MAESEVCCALLSVPCTKGPDSHRGEIVEGCQCQAHLDQDVAHTVELSHEIIRVHRHLRPNFTLLGIQVKSESSISLKSVELTCYQPLQEMRKFSV